MHPGIENQVLVTTLVATGIRPYARCHDQTAERAATPPIPGSLANPGINPESAATMREIGITYHFPPLCFERA